MAFITIPGLRGKIYVPRESPDNIRKHACKDCFSCQMCAESRCELCQKEKNVSGKALPEKWILKVTN